MSRPDEEEGDCAGGGVDGKVVMVVVEEGFPVKEAPPTPNPLTNGFIFGNTFFSFM